MNHHEGTNIVQKQIDSTLIINFDNVQADIKHDTAQREKLKDELGFYTDAVEDVAQDQKKIFADPALLPTKISNPQKGQSGLHNVYKEWHAFCHEKNVNLMEDWTENMSAILKELGINESNKITLLNQYKKEYSIYEKKNKAYQDSLNNIKKGFCGTSKLIDPQEIVANKAQCLKEFEEAKKSYNNVEVNLQIELTNYENWRQTTLMKCVQNLIFNNIEYNGKVCDHMTQIMPNFIESENQIQDIAHKSHMFNRFLRPKKQPLKPTTN